MGQYNSDGTWTSNSGRHYDGSSPISPEDYAEYQADSDTKYGLGPGDDPSVAGAVRGGNNALAGPRLGGNAPGAQLDTSGGDFQRQQTEGLMAALQQQAASGNGSWENALAEATKRASAAGQSVAVSTPNTSYGDALRNVGNAQGAAEQRGAGQAEILRNQSKLDAEDQLGQLFGNMGAQDIDQSAASSAARQGQRETNLMLKQRQAQTIGNTVQGAGQAVGTAASLSDGGRVPGRAVFGGDDPRNDTQPAMLSPDEIVVPRSEAGDPDRAAAFARAVAMHGARKMADGGGFGDYGHVSDDQHAQSQLWNDPKYAAERNRAWKPGDIDPTGPRDGSVDAFGAFGDIQAPSVENGAILDQSQFNKTRAGGRQLDEMLAARAGGNGPSVANQQMTNTVDDTLANAMRGSMAGAPAAALATGAAAQAQGGAGEAATTKAREQSSGQNAFAKRLTTSRGQELSLAQAQQQAAWRNTLTNLGIGVEQQNALRGIFSGAGSAAAGFAGAGSGKSGGPSGSSDVPSSGWYDEPIGPSEGPSSEAGDWPAPDEGAPQGAAFGGRIGYADGGIVARGPKGEKLETEREFIAGRAAAQQKEEDRRRVHEEETGDDNYRPRAKTAKAEPSMQDRITEFARKVGASVSSIPKFAEGGDVGDLMRPADQLVAPPGMLTTEEGVQPAPFTLVRPGPVDWKPDPKFAAPPEASTLLGQSDPATIAAIHARQNAKPLPKGIKPSVEPSEQKPTPAPASKPISGGVALPPSHALEEGFADNEAQLAAQANTDAEVLKARAEVEGLKAREMAQTSAQLDMKAATDRARQQTSGAMTRWTAAQEEFNRIDTNVDPGRFWASRTTGQKVLGIIGLALGAAGTGPDGINKAAVMMNNAIDRDLEAQKEQHELRLRKGSQNLQAAQTYYSMAREAGHDDIAATELAKAAALDAAALKSEQLVATPNEPIAKAKGMALSAALHGGALDKKKAGEQQTFENRVKNQTLNIQAVAAGAKGGMSEAERKEVGDVTAAARDALGLIGNIKSSLSRTQSAIPGKTAFNQHVGADAAELETDTAQLVAKMKDINKLGQIGPADKALLEEAIGDPKAVFTLEGSKRKKLDRVEQIIRDSVANQRISHGVR